MQSIRASFVLATLISALAAGSGCSILGMAAGAAASSSSSSSSSSSTGTSATGTSSSPSSATATAAATTPEPPPAPAAAECSADLAKLETALEDLFQADRGFSVATVALTPKELTQVAADGAVLAEASPAAYGHYVSLVKAAPAAADAKRVEALSRDGERIYLRGRAVHFLLDVPYGTAKVSNAAIEKILGPATNRNLKVITALAEKWG